MLEYLPRLPAKLRTIIMWGTAVRAIQHILDGVEELDLRCNEWLADLPSQWPQFQPRPYGDGGKLHWINLCGCPAARTIAGNLPAATVSALTHMAMAAASQIRADAPTPLPCQDFETYPWLELVGKGVEERAVLLPIVRDKAAAKTSRGVPP